MQARMEQAIEGLTRELSQTARNGDKMPTEAIKSAVVNAVTKAHGSLLKELGDKTDEDHEYLLNELRDMKDMVLKDLRSTREVSYTEHSSQQSKFIIIIIIIIIIILPCLYSF